MTEKTKTTIEDIELMSDAQWQDYRLNLWNKKREQYSASAPEWYMKDKNSYINFFESRNFQPKGTTIEQIKSMSDLEWSNYRQDSWAKKGQSYKGDLPDWYLSDKTKFLDYLKKNQKRN
jgi:hypothetical protein